MRNLLKKKHTRGKKTHFLRVSIEQSKLKITVFGDYMTLLGVIAQSHCDLFLLDAKRLVVDFKKACIQRRGDIVIGSRKRFT